MDKHLNSLEPPAELAKKFLSLYECLTNPAHTETLIQTIGDWLSEEDDPLYIKSLEQHAETVLNLTVDLLREKKSEHPDKEPTCTLRTTPDGISPEDVEQALGVTIVAHDTLAFTQWLNSSESSKLLRVVDDVGRGRLCLARKTVHFKAETVLDFWMNNSVLVETVETMLIRDLNISPSEILVLKEIAFGLRRSEIAKNLGKSVETIRSQIKSIANKIGVSGQIEIAAELRNLEIMGTAAPHTRTNKRLDLQYLALPDGRRLEYLEYGPSDGQPIVFFHCFLHGKHLPRTIEKPLAEANFRIISVSRAGFGGSTPRRAAGANILADITKDYKCMFQHLGLGRCHLLAHATGFATAFHFATKYPELTRKVLGLDPVPPINRFSDMTKLVGLFRAAALTMTRAPITFSLMTRFAMRRLDTFDDADKTYRRHILYPSIDLERLESSEGIDAGTRNVLDLKVNSLSQCSVEAQIFRSDWSAIGPQSNRRPEVILLHTKNNPFVSSKGTREFARSLDCQLVDLGETFPFLETHMKAILGKLK
ncbi:MAG: alpha/beta fold hydrolase [Alphaproteobacteria bacterium]|nr:alpha/beta fold hydrolase [Alphaproteobacteria bacterium]